MSDICDMSVGGIDLSKCYTINFEAKKPSHKEIEQYRKFKKAIKDSCGYLLIKDENGFNIEKSFCTKCGYDLNKCKTFSKTNEPT